MNEVIGLRGKVKTDGLPPRVVRKKAKGRTYYYYNTGKRTSAAPSSM